MDIKKIIKKENISIIDKELDWKEAIKLAAKPLLEQGYVEKRYPEEIINNTLKFGPYYVLAENVGFLHVRPEQGVISDQISVLLNKKPVSFSKNDKSKDVKLFITFAAKCSDDHLEIMKILAEIFGDEDKINAILNSDNEFDIYNLITNLENI